MGLRGTGENERDAVERATVRSMIAVNDGAFGIRKRIGTRTGSYYYFKIFFTRRFRSGFGLMTTLAASHLTSAWF